MVLPVTWVEAPPVTPLPFGLLSAAVVTDDLTPEQQRGGVGYLPLYCGEAHDDRGYCQPIPDGEDGLLTEESGLSQVQALPFTVYSLFSCKLVGLVDDGARRAQGNLALGEQRAVERVMAGRLAASDLAEDLTPAGGALHPVDGLALLEAYAGDNYGGVPTFHGDRTLATVLGTHRTIERQGTQLQTVLGSPFAAGAGYLALTGPAGADPAGAGEAWLWTTGQVMVRRTTVATVDPVPALSPVTNIFQALAYRPYTLSFECVAAAVRVTVPFTVPAS